MILHHIFTQMYRRQTAKTAGKQINEKPPFASQTPDSGHHLTLLHMVDYVRAQPDRKTAGECRVFGGETWIRVCRITIAI